MIFFVIFHSADYSGLKLLLVADMCCRWNRAKMSLKQRKDRVRQKKASFLAKQQTEDDD